MISCVTFDRSVPVDFSRRMTQFFADSGWTIVELEPGRVSLLEMHPGAKTVIVQDVPYTLHLADEEPVATTLAAPTTPETPKAKKR